jgi:hypothetical protein
MKSIVYNWRGFRSKNENLVIQKRLAEAITRRQFLTGGAAAGLLYALMDTEFFKELPDEKQDELIELSPDELAKLMPDVADPEYAKAVAEFEKENPPEEENTPIEISDSELKSQQFKKVSALMIAPEKLIDDRPWTMAPVFQSRDFGYFAAATEVDVDLIADTNPEIKKAVDMAYEFYKNFGLTRLKKYVYGNQAFFSYTSSQKANQKILFDTIETDKKQENPLTGEKQNIKFNKLPLAWTVANRVLLDQITLMSAELDSIKGDPKKEREVYDRYGVSPDYKGNKTVPREVVAKELIKLAGGSLSRMSNEVPVTGKHN